MNTQAIHEVTIKTQEGKMTFPQVVHELTEAGVESYFVDLAAGRKTYYMADGSAYAEPMILKLDPVAGEFSDSELVAAIRGAQADAIRYPEFVKRSTAAGVVGYWAFLTEKRCSTSAARASHTWKSSLARRIEAATYFPICTGPSFLYCVAGVPVMAAKVCSAAPDRLSK